jgi:hypothetical protein
VCLLSAPGLAGRFDVTVGQQTQGQQHGEEGRFEEEMVLPPSADRVVEHGKQERMEQVEPSS